MFPEKSIADLVTGLGIQFQLAGTIICLGLTLLLNRRGGNRPWVKWWAWSFAAVGLALTALLVWYYVLPGGPARNTMWQGITVTAMLYAAYAGGKILFLCCLLAGTWLLVTRGTIPRISLTTGALLTVSLVALFALIPTTLDRIVVWQAGLAVPVFITCAALLIRQPIERRTRGSRTLAIVCLMLAGLWALYIPAFLGFGTGERTLGERTLRWLIGHNSYVDVLFEFMLAFGMILAVLDDVFFEAEAARMTRLREVAESEERLSQIIRAASEGIILLDTARRIVHANPAALETLGCREQDLLGEPFDRFMTTGPADELWLGAAERHLRNAVTPPGGHELLGRRADGSEFPMELSLRATGDAGTTGYVLILRDRTQRVLYEEERARSQVRLAQAARLETIGRMVSGVAHELNNPLTAILAFAQDLLAQSKSLTDTEALTTIVQQSQRCRVIVQDLLTFARSKRDDRIPTPPHELVARVLAALERQAQAKGVQLEVAVPPGLPHLDVNPAALEQVLTNLLVNAIQAVDSGGRVDVRARVNGPVLSLVVEDNGPGIPPEALPQLFEPFFTTKGPGEGTGLGLSVSHAIVEQHGGTLRAENRTGPGTRGARFTADLPYLDRRAVSRKTPELPKSDVVSQPPRAARRVLVVDDEGPIRVAIRRYLERRGWQVDEARDGREALEVLGLDEGGRSRTSQYDAIVTDLKMPGVTGIEIHDRIASVAPTDLSKLVLITGDTASPEVAEFVTRLRQPLIQKPFDMRALADLLDRTVPLAAGAAPRTP